MSKKNIAPTKLSDSVIVDNLSNYKNINIFFFLLCIIPLYFLFSAINTFSLNLPFQDDYDAILKFLNTWESSKSKLPLLFMQHNEHIIFPSRVIYVLFYKIVGSVNFNSLIIIGNIQLVLIALIIIGFVNQISKRYSGIAALAISFCIFDLSNYENSNFSMAGMQNYGIILFFLVSMYFYNKPNKNNFHLLLAVFFQFLCAFSSGNGIIAGITLVLFNILKGDKKNTLIAIISFSLFTCAYFLIYKSIPNTTKGKSISDIISFFLKLSGSHFGYEDRIISAVVLITTLIGFVVYNNWNKINKDLLPLFAIIFFVLSSIGVVALFRSGGIEGIEHDSYAGRYLIYPHLFAASLFAILCVSLEKKTYGWVMIIICSIFFIKAYKENYTYGISGFERTNNRILTLDYYYPDSTIAKKITSESCEKKIYCIEDHKQ